MIVSVNKKYYYHDFELSFLFCLLFQIVIELNMQMRYNYELFVMSSKVERKEGGGGVGWVGS